MIDTMEGEGYLAILGNWHNLDQPCLMVVVYAQQDYHDKKTLWNNLTQLLENKNNFSILIGDFSEFRYESERNGIVFGLRGGCALLTHCSVVANGLRNPNTETLHGLDLRDSSEREGFLQERKLGGA
ncbi:hypothetical protein Tco_0657756, partial [Tanacetum coccineum]